MGLSVSNAALYIEDSQLVSNLLHFQLFYGRTQNMNISVILLLWSDARYQTVLFVALKTGLTSPSDTKKLYLKPFEIRDIGSLNGSLNLNFFDEIAVLLIREDELRHDHHHDFTFLTQTSAKVFQLRMYIQCSG